MKSLIKVANAGRIIDDRTSGSLREVDIAEVAEPDGLVVNGALHSCVGIVAGDTIGDLDVDVKAALLTASWEDDIGLVVQELVLGCIVQVVEGRRRRTSSGSTRNEVEELTKRWRGGGIVVHLVHENEESNTRRNRTSTRIGTNAASDLNLVELGFHANALSRTSAVSDAIEQEETACVDDIESRVVNVVLILVLRTHARELPVANERRPSATLFGPVVGRSSTVSPTSIVAAVVAGHCC